MKSNPINNRNEFLEDDRLALTKLQQIAKIGYWEWDLQNNKYLWSEGMYRIFGLDISCDPVAYPEIRQYFQPASWDSLSSHVEKCRRRGLAYKCDMELVRPDSSQKWVAISGMAVRNNNGVIEKLQGTVQDITDRINLQNALNAQVMRYQAAIETSMDGFLISDAEGEIVDVNNAYVRLSGYSREELLAMRICDVDAKMNQDEILDAIKKIVEIGCGHFETLHRRKDGSVWPVEVTASYWLSNGLNFAFIRDISKRKKLQYEIEKRRSELETLQRHQVAAQTAAAFAHELNQPLLAISSYCEASMMLLDENKPELDKVRKAISESARQALRAGESIHAMIDTLNVENIPLELFELSSEVRHVLVMARTEYNLNYHFVLKMEEKELLVHANRVHLQKVLLNLLYNSIEAAQQVGVDKPEVTVSIGVQVEPRAALITLQDNGPGLSQEVLTHLFEPFFTTKSRGIGLGLMISRALVEINGGQLWVDSREGPGATFHLTLPLGA